MTDRVVVDGDLCQGHARCFSIDEGMFPIDDEGYSLLGGKGEIEIAPELVEKARAAAQICPERAIRVLSD